MKKQKTSSHQLLQTQHQHQHQQRERRNKADRFKVFSQFLGGKLPKPIDSSTQRPTFIPFKHLWREKEKEKPERMFAAENGLKGDPRLQAISEAIRVVPHFPKPGIMFQDITPLLLDHKTFKHVVDIFVDRYRDMDISVVAGVEARGFMFGPSIALAIGAKFVPLRKPRKLPGEVISEAYELEYGTDCLEMHVGAVQPGERALVIDDLIATGGTLSAAIRLLERVGAEVVECGCVIGLPEVKGQCRLNGKPLYILVEPRELDDEICSSSAWADCRNNGASLEQMAVNV